MRQLQGSIFDLVVDETPIDDGVIVVSDFHNLSAEASKFVAYWSNAKQFGLDIETFGDGELDGLNCWRGHIRLIQIALSSGKTLVIDLGGWSKLDAVGDINYYQKFKDSELFNIFSERLWNENVNKVLHNGKFDALWIRQKFGLRTRTIRDTEILSRVMWSGVFSYNHSLKDVAKRVLGVDLDKKEQKSDFGSKITNSQLNYAARDAQITLEIFQHLGSNIKSDGLMFTALSDCGSIEAFVEMEYKGFPVNEVKLDNIIARYREIQNALSNEWDSYCPGLKHTQSTKIKGWINDKYSLGITGTSQEDLAPYWDIRPLKVLAIIRTLDTYINYIETAKECLGYYQDGRVRGNYKVVNRQGLGRSSCGAMKANNKVVCPGLNLQNPTSPAKMPGEFKALGMPALRDIFEAPEGYKLIVADLSGAHGRIAAEASQDSVLCKALREGLDFHSITAEGLAKLQGKNWTAEEIAKGRKDKSDPDKDSKETLRQTAKPTFYGCVPVEDSQALTRQGWKFYHELSIGDEILAYNPDSGLNEFTPILELFHYEDAPVIRLKSGNGKHDNSDDNEFGSAWTIRCTENHRWYGHKWTHTAKYANSNKYNKVVNHSDFWTTEFFDSMNACKSNRRILVSAPYKGGEGVVEKAFDIDGAILEKYDRDWIIDVINMTTGERNWFLQSFLLGEGYLRKNAKGVATSWGFCQNPGKILDAVMLAAYLQGKRLSCYTDKYRSTKSNKANFDTVRVQIFNSKSSKGDSLRLPVVTGQKMLYTPSGNSDVWCPRTAFGTWVLRQGYTITITGNSLNLQGKTTLKQTAEKDGVTMTEDEAEKAIAAWKATYKGIVNFQKQISGNANKFNIELPGAPGKWGVVISLSGRRIYFPKKFNAHLKAMSVYEPQAVAGYWTATEADVIKPAMLGIQRAIDEHPEWDAWICNLAHDEIDVIVKDEYAEIVSKMVWYYETEAFKHFLKIVPVEEPHNPGKPPWLNYICKSWSEK